MDEVIYEEFKGTGNIVHLREGWPRKGLSFININRSGTRRKNYLLNLIYCKRFGFYLNLHDMDESRRLSFC